VIRRRLLWVLGAAALGGSCVSQSKYEEQVRLADTLQLQYDQLQVYLADLERRGIEAPSTSEVPQPTATEAGLAEIEALRVRSPAAAAAGPAGRDLEAERAAIQARIDALDAGSEAISPVAVEGGYGFAISEQVVFSSGSAELRDEGRGVLLDLAREIGAGDFAMVWVRGHTDAVPVKLAETLARFPHGNLQLSAARAVEVAALLVAEGGLPAEKVAVAGLGPSRPVADNGTPEGRSQNRRVEIFVLEEPTDAESRGGL
jgi:flagellar motor protein MotB